MLVARAPSVTMQAEPETQGSTRAPASPPDVTIVANDVGSVGGMERVLAELAVGLRKLGHRVTVIARTCEVPVAAGVEFHRVRGPARPFLLAYPWFVLAGSLIVWRRRRGIVQATGAVVLNRVDVVAVHYCHQVGPAHASRSSALFRAHVKLVRVVKRVSERLCFRRNRAATFICVSEGVAEEVRTHYPELSEHVLTVHNGVDVDAFAPGVRRREAGALRTRLGIGDGQLVAAFVGSEWERKGLEPLIRASAAAGGWDVVVAGDGDQRRYQALADSLGIAGQVHWLGVTNDVQLVYALSDAFVLPTSYETFSLVTFEAAASGLPILATPVSGVRELIEDGVNGFLITREPELIAQRLAELGADPQLRERLGREARESALRFSWGTMVAGYRDVYARLARDRDHALAA
jgi:glycosyltransferase involved in cell wall biosynthesis